ncbi:MAG: pitrilysin family protein [Acidobacteriota bacterium]
MTPPVAPPSPLDRTRTPAPGQRRPFRLPDFTTANLDNGLRLLLAPLHSVPLATATVMMPGGGQYAPPDRPGLPSLHGELLDEGAHGRSAMDIARDIERLGGGLQSTASWNMTRVEIDVLARHLDPGLDLMARVALDADFPEAEIERSREEQVAELLRRRAVPRNLAEDAFNFAVYADTVYAHPLPGTADSLRAIDRDDILRFHRRHAVPRGGAVVAVGDFEPARLVERFRETFAGWTADEEPPQPEIRPVPLDGTRVFLVDRPKAAQTQLLIGHRCLPRRHPDYHALMVMNVLFGGKFTSRVNLNLRERHGFTYGANSFLVRRRGPGPFYVRTAVANDVVGAATRETLTELRRLQQDLVEEEELRETQDYILGLFPLTRQTIREISDSLQALVIFDLPDDHFERFPAVLGEVTREDILDTAQRHLHPDAIAIVAVGPAAELRPQLEGFGPIETIDLP